MSVPPYSPRIYTFCRNALWVLLKVWNRLEVHGAEHVPDKGGVLLVANHVSFLDPPALGCAAIKRHVRYLARDTLFSPPWFGRLLHNVAVVPLSRERSDVGALKKALAVLKAGDCLGLFPEGTRSPDGKMAEAKGGVGFIVAKSGAVVVPAYIDGTYRALSRHHRWIRPIKVRVFFGPPLTSEELNAIPNGPDYYDKIGALVTARIRALMPPSAK